MVLLIEKVLHRGPIDAWTKVITRRICTSKVENIWHLVYFSALGKCPQENAFLFVHCILVAAVAIPILCPRPPVRDKIRCKKTRFFDFDAEEIKLLFPDHDKKSSKY